MKKTKGILLILVLAIALLAGCSVHDGTNKDPVTDSTESAVSGTTIRVGTMPVTVGSSLDYAMKQGWFEEAGINVERILFATGAPINEALSAQQIDISISGPASIYAVASGDITWIGDINTSTGSGIYVRPDSPVLNDKGNIADAPEMYGSAETLKGLTIIGPLGTTSQFNAVAWMDRFGLTANDYSMLSMDFGPATQAFLTGEGDAVAVPPPYTVQLEEAGYVGAAPLEDAANTILCDGIGVRTAYLEENRETVVEFMKILYRAQEVLANDDAVAADLCFEFYNENGREYSEADIQSELDVRDWVDEEYMEADDYVFGQWLVELGEFYVNDGKILPEDFPNIRAGLDASIIEEVYGFSLNLPPE